ncbi:MAG: zinc transport system ATP-binding protein [Gammaproteobacteria bacterium]
MNTLPKTDNALLEIRALDVAFGTNQVLHGVDLAVTTGEIVTLIGPNGSGKTTLVRAALGLLQPSSGSIWRKPNLRIGYVPQKLSVDTSLPLSVRRFVTLGRHVSAVSACAALDELGLNAMGEQAIQSLSGGEMRRVLLARAMAHQPELLVLDEPTAGVDVGGQADLYGLIEELRKRHGCAVLLISHDLHLVMANTDRVVCLNHHVCCTGTPQDIAQHPEYLTLFGSHHQARLALYTHHHDHSHDLHGDAHDAEKSHSSDEGETLTGSTATSLAEHDNG